MSFNSGLEPFGSALSVVSESEIVADDHGFRIQGVFEDRLIKLFGGAVGKMFIERENNGQ